MTLRIGEFIGGANNALPFSLGPGTTANMHITLHRDKIWQSYRKRIRHEFAVANDAKGTKR
jgi:hypothetical protein